ncbi:MAG TPA: hypothetical protein VIG92_01400, partial [Rhodospirillales bacterium]
RMLQYQRNRATDDLGNYEGVVDVPMLNVDQALALVMYWEKSYSLDDQWPRSTADQLMVTAAKVDPDSKRPTRSLADVLDAGEALVQWSFLGARADQLEPMCTHVTLSPRGERTKGFCPKDFRYDDGKAAQQARLIRLGLAIQRVYKLVKPPPLTNPLRGLAALLVIAGLLFLENRN